MKSTAPFDSISPVFNTQTSNRPIYSSKVRRKKLSSSGTEGTVALEQEKEASQADFKVVWIEKVWSSSNEEAETSWSTPLGDLSFGPVEVKVEGESANEPRS